MIERPRINTDIPTTGSPSEVSPPYETAPSTPAKETKGKKALEEELRTSDSALRIGESSLDQGATSLDVIFATLDLADNVVEGVEAERALRIAKKEASSVLDPKGREEEVREKALKTLKDLNAAKRMQDEMRPHEAVFVRAFVNNMFESDEVSESDYQRGIEEFSTAISLGATVEQGKKYARLRLSGKDRVDAANEGLSAERKKSGDTIEVERREGNTILKITSRSSTSVPYRDPFELFDISEDRAKRKESEAGPKDIQAKAFVQKIQDLEETGGVIEEESAHAKTLGEIGKSHLEFLRR